MGYLDFSFGDGNLTKFERIQEVSSEPYFLSGFIFLGVVLAFLVFVVGVTRVSSKSRRVCFSSSIYYKFVFVLAIFIILVLVWFFLPIHLAWI